MLTELSTFKSLPNCKNLDSTKFKVCVDNKKDFAEMKKKKNVFDRVENIVGKGENAGYQHFLSFSHNVF